MRCVADYTTGQSFFKVSDAVTISAPDLTFLNFLPKGIATPTTLNDDCYGLSFDSRYMIEFENSNITVAAVNTRIVQEILLYHASEAVSLFLRSCSYFLPPVIAPIVVFIGLRFARLTLCLVSILLRCIQMEFRERLSDLTLRTTLHVSLSETPSLNSRRALESGAQIHEGKRARLRKPGIGLSLGSLPPIGECVHLHGTASGSRTPVTWMRTRRLYHWTNAA